MYGRGVPKWLESPIQPAITHQLSGFDGMGSTNQLEVDMPDGSFKLFYSITSDLGAALAAGGRPKKPDIIVSGSVIPQGYYTVTTFMGGYLLDGCPLNVIFGQGWIQGQQEALAAAGIYPNCPQVKAMVPVSPLETTMNTPILSTAGTTINAPAFTPTMPSGTTGVLSFASPVTPAQTVYSPQAPASPTGMTAQDMGAGQTSMTLGLPSWLPYAAVAVVALMLLRRK
jgi:hypothetical protein